MDDDSDLPKPDNLEFNFAKCHTAVTNKYQSELEVASTEALVLIADQVAKHHINEDQIWDITQAVYQLAAMKKTAQHIRSNITIQDKPGIEYKQWEPGQKDVNPEYLQRLNKRLLAKLSLNLENRELHVQEVISRHIPDIGEKELNLIVGRIGEKLNEILSIPSGPSRS